MFQKSPASPVQFSPLDADLFVQLGGVGSDTAALKSMAVSRLLYGRAHEKRTVEVGGNKTVTVEEGETWCSITTLAEDITAATGKRWKRHQIKYALSLVPEVERRQARGGRSRGYYGSCFRVPPEFFPSSSRLVMPDREYRVSRYGTPNEYRFSQILVGSYEGGERRVTDADYFRRKVHEGALPAPAYMLGGRWRGVASVGNPDAPVYIPFWTVDVDGANPVDSYEDARLVMERLEEAGIDPEVCVVAYTGGRGIHIEIPAQVAGPRVYESADAARLTMQEFFERLVGDIDSYDPSTLSPRSMVRLYGSKHPSGRMEKRGTDGLTFLSKPMHHFFEVVRQGGDLSSVRRASRRRSVEAQVDDAEAEARERLKEMELARRFSGERNIGECVGRVLQGVQESEQWNDRWAGRHLALYILACFVLEHEGQAEQVCSALGIMPEEDPLRYWNQHLSYPPLPEGDYRSIIRNAKRTVQ